MPSRLLQTQSWSVKCLLRKGIIFNITKCMFTFRDISSYFIIHFPIENVFAVVLSKKAKYLSQRVILTNYTNYSPWLSIINNEKLQLEQIENLLTFFLLLLHSSSISRGCCSLLAVTRALCNFETFPLSSDRNHSMNVMNCTTENKITCFLTDSAQERIS